MIITALLQASRDAHQRYRDALPRRVANGSGGTIVVPGDAIAAGEALAAACRFRAEAHVSDPQHTHPAWDEEAATHPHDALLDFYIEQLTRGPFASVDEIPDTELVNRDRGDEA